MSKVKIITTLENITENETLRGNYFGIYNQNKIVYKENAILCEVHLLENAIMYIRKINEKESFIFSFQEKESSYIEYKNGKQILKIPLYTLKINKNNQNIDILYQVDDKAKFHFILEYGM